MDLPIYFHHRGNAIKSKMLRTNTIYDYEIDRGPALYEQYQYPYAKLVPNLKMPRSLEREINASRPAIEEDARVLPPNILVARKGTLKPDTLNWGLAKREQIIKMTDYENVYHEKKYFPVCYESAVETNNIHMLVMAAMPSYDEAKEDGTGKILGGYSFPSLEIPSFEESSTKLSHTHQLLDEYWTDSSRLSEDIPELIINEHSFDDPLDVEAELNEARADIVDQISNTYDLLTDVAEFSETAKMVMSMIQSLRHPMEKMKEIQKQYQRASRKGRVPMQVLSDLSAQWMQYRYGIMPVVYSIQDMLELYTQKGVFRSVRNVKEKNVIQGPPEFGDRPLHYFEGYKNISIRGTGKAFYDSHALSLAAQVRVNIPATLWDITRFSWMIDWFLNVGDFINAQCHQYTSIATQEVLCTAVKIETNVQEKLYMPRSIKEYEPTVLTSLNGTRPFRDEWVQQWRSKLPGSSLVKHGGGVLSEETISSYTRLQFQPNEVYIDINPSITWRRSLDALSLLTMATNNRLRKLK